MDFGSISSNFGDGIAFVIQREGMNSIGPGFGLAYDGISPSVAVAFRTNLIDEIHLWANGNASTNLISPVSLSGLTAGTHNVIFNWNACDTTLTVDIDGDGVDVTWSNDIVKNYFSENSESIYWGFTSTTITGFYQHRVCNIDLKVTDDDVSDICSCAPFLQCGDNVSLNTNGLTGESFILDCNFSGRSNFSNSVWFNIVGTGGSITISTCNGSYYEQEINVYTGNCDNLSCHSGETDGCGNSGPTLTFSTSTNQIYRVMIGVFGDGKPGGNLDVQITCDGCPTGNLSFLPPQHFYDSESYLIDVNGTITAQNIHFGGSDISYNASSNVNLSHNFEVKKGAILSIETVGCPQFANESAQK